MGGWVLKSFCEKAPPPPPNTLVYFSTFIQKFPIKSWPRLPLCLINISHFRNDSEDVQIFWPFLKKYGHCFKPYLRHIHQTVQIFQFIQKENLVFRYCKPSVVRFCIYVIEQSELKWKGFSQFQSTAFSLYNWKRAFPKFHIQL